MTAELSMFIAISAFVLNLVTMWALLKLRDEQRGIVNRIFGRLNYLEIGMSHHQLIPLPWEVEDVEDLPSQTNSFKHQGNVVYLRDGKEKGGRYE